MRDHHIRGSRHLGAAGLLVLAMLAPAAPAAATHVEAPPSLGVYRVPYEDGTSVRVSRDHHDHDPVRDRIDMAGVGSGPHAIVAAAPGFIRAIVDHHLVEDGDCAYNNYVWIAHPNGEWTKYSHMSPGSTTGDAGLSVGLPVAAGTFLGWEDDIGCASGEHLHWEVAVPDDPTDPFNPVGGYIRGTNRVPRVCVPGGQLVSDETYAAIACPQADLEVSSVQVVNPPSAMSYATATSVTVRATLRNLSGADQVAELRLRVEPPHMCWALAGSSYSTSHDVTIDVPEGQTVVVERPFSLQCASPGLNRTFTFEAQIRSSGPAAQWRLDNDRATTAVTIHSLARIDVALPRWDLAAITGASPVDFQVGRVLRAPALLDVGNQGRAGSERVDWTDPIEVAVSRELVIPAGLTGGLVVSEAESAGRVVVQHANGAREVIERPRAGSVVDAAGPALLHVSAPAGELAVNQQRSLSAGVTLRCDKAGTFRPSLVVSVWPAERHFLDPAPSDNVRFARPEVVCATPVRINLEPGDPANAVDPSGDRPATVAVLTTAAGEGGLPGAFDATTVVATSVRFGAPAALARGGGAPDLDGVATLVDSFEPDDRTRDGDRDAVLSFRAAGVGLGAGATEACVTGTYAVDRRTTQRFVGCDRVGDGTGPS